MHKRINLKQFRHFFIVPNVWKLSILISLPLMLFYFPLVLVLVVSLAFVLAFDRMLVAVVHSPCLSVSSSSRPFRGSLRHPLHCPMSSKIKTLYLMIFLTFSNNFRNRFLTSFRAIFRVSWQYQSQIFIKSLNWVFTKVSDDTVELH